VGYTLIYGESKYFTYFSKNIIISYIGILFISILSGYILYKNQKCLIETQKKEKYKIESYTDELTQLLNRKFYNKKLHEKITLCNRYDEVSFSFILFDIDFFKSINDTYGHDKGDEVLIEISALIKSIVRKNDYFCRVGGEEFTLILPHTNLKNAISLSEKIRKSVENDLNTIEDRIITISIGVTEFKKGDDENSIYKRVDNHLYNSKNSGRNTVTSDLNI
jgi:diguanylate cyclase (GGDEF)-like protein